MVTHLNDKHVKNLDRVRQFLKGTEALELVIEDKHITLISANPHHLP